MRTACARPCAKSRRQATADTSACSRISRLVKLDRARHTAKVESATPLPPELQASVQAALERVYGPGLTTSFTEQPGADRRNAHPGGQRCLRRQRAGRAGRIGSKLLTRT